MNKARVEALSDGVFAIAITLLVLTIAAPNNYQHLASELARRWPALAAYVVSFTVIGIMWLNHHTIFGHLEHLDRPFVYLNLLLLLTVAFIPYPTHVFGEALRRGDAQVAAVFYSVVMSLNAFAWSALWLYASSGRRLLTDRFPEAQRRTATVAFIMGAGMYILTVGVAFLNAYACLVFHGVLAAYYALDPISRRVARSLSTSE